MALPEHWVPFVMGINYRTYIFCFLIGLIAALMATPWVIRLAHRVGALDRPRHRKIHKKVTPLMGGLAIFIGMWLPLFLLGFHNNTIAQSVRDETHPLLLILGGGFFMMLIGMADDRFGLRARYKLFCQIPIAVALVWGGVRFNTISLPWGETLEFHFLGAVVSGFWLIGVTNAMNLIDGIDGLAAGVALFVASTNAIIATLNGDALLAVLMWSMAGACLGFLRYNFNPASVFLGDTGSLFLGATLAVSSALCNAKETMVTSLFVPTLLVGYPVIDTLLSVARRALRGKPIFSGDASHIHHRLLAKGFNHRRAALIIYGVCVIFSLVALAIVMRTDFATALAVLSVSSVLLGGLWYLGYLQYFISPKMREDRRQFQVSYHYALMIKAKLALAGNSDAVFDLLRDIGGQFGMKAIIISRGGTVAAAPESNASGAGNDPLALYNRDDYEFSNTGLRIRLLFATDRLSQDLLTENRLLLAEVIEAANARLHSLDQPHPARPSLRQPISARPTAATCLALPGLESRAGELPK